VVAIVLVVGFVSLPLVTPQRSLAIVVPATTARVAQFCIVFAVLAAYFSWCWSQGRRTLAMKTWRLRLVRADGGTVAVRTALLRYLAAWVGPALAVLAYVAIAPSGWGAHAAWLVGLNFLWAFVDPGRQFLHDRFAGTRIVVNEGQTLIPGNSRE
jgi:uncharacterized RDD family membrane protein YckC